MIHPGRFGRIILIILLPVFLYSACSTKKSVKFMKTPVAPGTNIAVMIDAKNDHKNVVLEKFMTRGYTVIAINASDYYNIDSIFDIHDLKKLSYRGTVGDSLVNMERTYNNIYKLHIYNYEVNKAEFINELKTKLKVQYLILLDLKDWQDISWARAINLNNYEVVWVENYPNKFRDQIPDVIEHFINSMSGK